MASAIMMVWLIPSKISGNAKGSSTLNSLWRGVAPQAMAASTTVDGTRIKPR